MTSTQHGRASSFMILISLATLLIIGTVQQSRLQRWLQHSIKAPKVVIFPEGTVPPGLFYDSRFPDDDRVLTQWRYTPRGYSNETAAKIILIWSGIRSTHYWFHRKGNEIFELENCLVKTCTVTGNRSLAHKADIIIFEGLSRKSIPTHKRPNSQVWMFYEKEAPWLSGQLQGLENQLNWTSTYRRDSTILAPYQKFYPYKKPRNVTKRNYALGKSKKVAWFVSNCASSNQRHAYAKELQKHIEVDIFGRCGSMSCGERKSSKCYDMLQEKYKFYLAFENSNCRDYITEKLWVNSLQYNVIPIVRGAPPDDYRKQAPLNSFIHVDDFRSPKDLAQYLKLLDENDDLYNLYFDWKGSGEFYNPHQQFWWCRLCGMLHAPRSSHVIANPHEWWRGKGVCIGGDSWTKHGYVAKTPIGLRHNSTN